jgi:putative beta-lysine N-acetyltransferase
MYDTIEKLDHSLIQHGPANNRIYLMKLSGQDLPGLLDKLDALAEQHRYTKIFTKVPLQTKPLFEQRGYSEEAVIPGFFHGETEAVFLSRFVDPQRELDPSQKQIEAILDIAAEKAHQPDAKSLPDTFEIRQVRPDEAEAMAELFTVVFESYPFPVHDPGYLRETMESHIAYFAAYENGTMVAVSSAEIDAEAENAEMTDFATLPDSRGKGLARCLLTHMEQQMRREGLKTGYTIARALSAGMNITFARAGYTYSGTLTHNTNICGKLESMNVWYKPLNEP